jgi:hypothetical protein
VTIADDEQNDENNKDEKTKYNYIGYTQDFPIDHSKYHYDPSLLMKLARESVRKRDYYSAIRYLNIILMKNPRNHAAVFYKKEVMMALENLKRSKKKYDIINE